MANDFYTPEPISDTYNIRRRRLIIIFIIVGILCLFAIGVASWYKLTYSSTLSLTYAPSSATATINGVTISASVKHMKPGNYTLTLKKDGFTPQTTTISLSPNHTTVSVLALLPNNSSTSDWYLQHPTDQKIYEKVGSIGAGTAANDFQKSFPIAKILPLTGTTYSINYGASPDKKGRYAVFITYYTTGKQDALTAIESFNYNPDDYEIIFTNGDSGQTSQN